MYPFDSLLEDITITSTKGTTQGFLNINVGLTLHSKGISLESDNESNLVEETNDILF